MNGTNPVDVFTYVYWKQLGWERERVLGFCANDSLRLKWATEKVTGIPFHQIDAFCVGEHGDGQVRLYDQMRREGLSLDLTEEDKAEIEKLTADWFTNYQALNSGRTSGWTSGVMLAEIIEAIVTDSLNIMPCSMPIEGELGYNHVAIGVPCVLGAGGVQQVLDPKLTPAQKEKLDQTVSKITGLIKSINF